MEPSSGFELRPRSIGELLDLSFRVYKQRFKLFAVIGIGISLLAHCVSLVWNAAVFATVQAPTAEEFSPATVVVIAVGLPLVIVMTFLIYSFGALNIAAATEDAFFGRPSGLRTVLARSRPRFLAGAWTAFLTGVPILVGFICCIVPGIFLSVLLVFAVVLTYLEGKSGLAAMNRSVELVARRGQTGFSTEANWARVLVVGVVSLVVFYALSFLATLPVLGAAMIEAARGQTMHQTALGRQMLPLWLLLPLNLIGAVLQGVLIPITMIPWPIVYYDIRTRHEGLDLEMALGRAASGETRDLSLSPEP